MITVISGTNRPDSKSKIIANFYLSVLEAHSNDNVELLSLEDVPTSIYHSKMYDGEFQLNELTEIQDKYIIPANKWVFILPEYNGSFPGVMKLFIDALSVKNYKETFSNKKLALVGLSSGRSGNIRGLDHMTNCMNYLGTEVFLSKLPISQVDKLVSNEAIADIATQKLIAEHAKDFLAF